MTRKTTTRNSWTAKETDILRREYPTNPVSLIAERLSRSVCSVRSRAKKLGLMKAKQRFQWSERPDADEFLRANYRKRGSRWCAAQLHASRSAVFQRANQLGLSQRRVCASNANIKAAIAEHHPRGLSDREIADGLAEQLGCAVDRHRVGKIRRSLGLADNSMSEHRRKNVAKRTREQIEAAGVSSLAEIRNKRWNQWKRDLGWPEELTVRAVQSLEMFYRHGPLTRVQLCKLLGVSSAKRTAPTSNETGGTVLAELARAGLISRLQKAIKVPGDLVLHNQPCSRPGGSTRQNKTKHIDLYLLNPGVKPNAHRKERKPAAV